MKSIGLDVVLRNSQVWMHYDFELWICKFAYVKYFLYLCSQILQPILTILIIAQYIDIMDERERLIEIMKSQELNSKQLSLELGVSAGTISNILLSFWAALFIKNNPF